MRVLHPTDGSAPAREGERLIASMFDPTKAAIHAFCVASEAVYIPDTLDGRYELDRLDVPPPDPGAVATEAADQLSVAGFAVSSGSSRGNPSFEILRELERHAYDLVVLGAGHSTWLGNILLGSVSTHVLHHAPCSVLVTHRAPAGSGHVLVGIDGSEEALFSARLTTSFLDPTRSRLSLVTAVAQPWVSVAAYPPGPPFGSFTEYHKAQGVQIERAWQLVNKARDEMRDHGFSAEAAVLSGSPGPQLLKEAENLSTDLVVMGSRGLGPIKRAFLGSVSDQVVRHAPATLVGRFSTGRQHMDERSPR